MSEIHFNTYLFTQYLKIPFQHVINIKNVNEIVYFFVPTEFEIQCAFHTAHLSVG